ncbi:hypothetical protein MKK75_14140 [Methylobacterium sp. J-030]|uniref:hypothetical protein n=1 Tax=Methylobacterium sp. J-030 TaxID=2836627 RepID=UPI001FB9985D|nr:hypothetical protein [Methylobacterium sp. J-030]MCJ2069920.1 hypothetical protein [Methylobacterium sp. J-030]
MRVRCRLVLTPLLALLPLAVFVPARAGEFAPVPPAPGMALTPPEPGMANSVAVRPSAPPAIPAPPQIDPGEGHRRPRALGAGFPVIGGQLPNQRTGSRHQHVVHDICIGC